MQDVMDPIATFNNLYKGWWKIVTLAVIGGLLGLGLSFVLPPMYEAEAIFHTSLPSALSACAAMKNTLPGMKFKNRAGARNLKTGHSSLTGPAGN